MPLHPQLNQEVLGSLQDRLAGVGVVLVDPSSQLVLVWMEPPGGPPLQDVKLRFAGSLAALDELGALIGGMDAQGLPEETF